MNDSSRVAEAVPVEDVVRSVNCRESLVDHQMGLGVGNIALVSGIYSTEAFVIITIPRVGWRLKYDICPSGIKGNYLFSWSTRNSEITLLPSSNILVIFEVLFSKFSICSLIENLPLFVKK